MRKAIFFLMAVLMVFLAGVRAAARAMPQAVPGWAYVVAVVDSGGEYAVLENQTPNVLYMNSGNPQIFFCGEMRGEESNREGVTEIPIAAGGRLHEFFMDDDFRILDELELPYETTEEDCASGLVIRLLVLPDEPDEPDPDHPDPDEPEPDVPQPGDPEQGGLEAPAGGVGTNMEPEPVRVWGESGKEGMLNGTQPLNPGGILLNSLNKPAASVPAAETVRDQAAAATRDALENMEHMDESGAVHVPVVLRDPGVLSPEAVQELDEAISRELPGEVTERTVEIKADTTENGRVTARMYLDLDKLRQLNAAVDTRIDSGADSVGNRAVKAHFERYFENRVRVASFRHQGAFGMDIPFAAKIDLSDLDEDALLFYTYDVRRNAYQRLDAPYGVDRHGYLHLVTDRGGSVVVTDQPLSPRAPNGPGRVKGAVWDP